MHLHHIIPSHAFLIPIRPAHHIFLPIAHPRLNFYIDLYGYAVIHWGEGTLLVAILPKKSDFPFFRSHQGKKPGVRSQDSLSPTCYSFFLSWLDCVCCEHTCTAVVACPEHSISNCKLMCAQLHTSPVLFLVM